MQLVFFSSTFTAPYMYRKIRCGEYCSTFWENFLQTKQGLKTKGTRVSTFQSNVTENSGYITLRLHAPSSSQPSIHPSRHPAHAQSSRPAREQARKEASAAMEYWYPCNGGSGCSKEKRPPLKRGQLKLQIARTLLGSLAAPVAKNRDRGFGR